MCGDDGGVARRAFCERRPVGVKKGVAGGAQAAHAFGLRPDGEIAMRTSWAPIAQKPGKIMLLEETIRETNERLKLV
jgi:hypothetical protein